VNEWRETTIGEFCPFSYGKGLPENRRNSTGNVPVFGSNGFVGSHDSPLTEGPTIIIGRKGTVGAVHYSPVPCWPIDTTFWISEADYTTLRFKYYLLKSVGLEWMNSDSAVPGLNREAAHARRILMPPLSEQRAIAHILGTLDDKIELNRRMNQTLEAIAQALFKSWFVDFEPFRDQGMQGSPLGEIPGGWKVRKIGEVLELKYGKGLREDGRQPGDIPVYGSNGQVGWHNMSLVKGPGIVVGRKGNPGTVIWVPTHFFPIDTTFFVEAKRPIQSMAYLFYALRSLDLPSLAADSAVPGLNRNMAYMSDILVPPAKILSEFDSYANPFMQKVYANEKESRNLADIRDTLLPKLLSREIQVKEAEKFVEMKL
jgi:type I restriction enzyme S subunit